MNPLLNFISTLFLIGTTFNLNVSSNPLPANEKSFKNAHFLSEQEFRNILNSDVKKLDQLATTRGLGSKPVNTFLVGNYADIKSSLQNAQQVPRLGRNGKPITNLFRSNTDFRQVKMKRNDKGILTGLSIQKPKPFIAGVITNSGQRVPVHFEKARQTMPKNTRVIIPNLQGFNGRVEFRNKRTGARIMQTNNPQGGNSGATTSSKTTNSGNFGGNVLNARQHQGLPSSSFGSSNKANTNQGFPGLKRKNTQQQGQQNKRPRWGG